MPEIIKYLGIDWGKKRIGLSVADSETKIALPLKIVSNYSEVLKVIQEEGADVLVIGAPRRLSGEAGLPADFEKFVSYLKEKTGKKIFLTDERFSSKAADALVGQRDKARRDALAAMLILSSFLEAKQNGRNL